MAQTISEKKHAHQSIPRWHGVALFFVVMSALALISLNYRSAYEYDFWWHLAVGKWEFEHKAIMFHDVFSYTFPGQYWNNLSWLFDVSHYLLYTTLGNWYIIIIRLVTYVTSYILLLKTIRLKKGTSAIISLSLLLFAVPQLRRWVRPELTLPIFVALYLYCLYKYKYYRSRLIYLLPFAQIVWTACNNGYVFGPVLIGVFFAGELIRSLARNSQSVINIVNSRSLQKYLLVLILTTLALVINPYGIGILRWIGISYLGGENIRQATLFISEFRAVPLSSIFSFSIYDPMTIYYSELLITGCMLLFLAGRTIVRTGTTKARAIFLSIQYEDLFLYVLFAYLSLAHVRLIFSFMFVAAFLITKNLPKFKAKWTNGLTPYVLFLLSLTSFYFYFKNTDLNLHWQYPNETLHFIREHDLKGPMFNDYGLGGFLTWATYPQLQVFIDGRTPNVYDNDFFWYYRHITNKTIFNALSEKYQFNLFFTFTNYGSVIKDDPSWALVSFDNAAVVYVKDTETNKALINAYRYKLLNPTRDPNSYLDVCDKPAEKRQLLSELQRNISEVPMSLYSATVLGSLVLNCKDVSTSDYGQTANLLSGIVSASDIRAQVLYEQLGNILTRLQKDPEAIVAFKNSVSLGKTPANMTGLAIALHNVGNYKESEKIFKIIQTLPGGDAPPTEYYQIYGRVSYQLDHNARAITLFKQYMNLVGPKKIEAQDYIDLSNAYKDNGQLDEANEYGDLARNFKTPTSTDVLHE